MSRTVLITGATGNVSSALLQALRSTPLKLRALVRDANRAAALRAQQVELAVGDLDEPESLPRAFEGIDDLWLLTAVGPRAPENSMNALWAARRAGVKRVVRMSAIGAAHDAPTRNGRLHALSDQELASSGLRYTILRPHFFMQNLLGSAATIAQQGNFYFSLGDGRLGMVDVRDIGEVAARVLSEDDRKHDGKIYTLTGPAALSMAEVAEQLGGALGKAVHYVSVTDAAALEGMRQAQLPAWVAGMLSEYMQAYRAGWGDFTTTHVQDVTGRVPRSFASFARELWPRG